MEFKEKIKEKINFSANDLFNHESWISGDGPIDSQKLMELGLHDVTDDPRWFREKFEGHGYHLAAYQDAGGNYWLFELDGDNHEMIYCGSLAIFFEEIGLPAGQFQPTKSFAG